MVGRRVARFGLGAVAILFAAGLTLIASLPGGSPIELRSVRIDTRNSPPLRLRLYRLMHRHESSPAVVICPALNVPPEMFHVMAMEIAGTGMVVAIVDFFGEKPDESRQALADSAIERASADLEGALRFMRALSGVDPLRTSVVGHSFGATVALEVAMRDSAVRGTVMIGMSGDLSPTRPANVLLVAGLYDELHPQHALLSSLASGIGRADVSADTLYGDFRNGTARRLVAIPSVSHTAEVLHPQLITEVVRWLSDASGWPRPQAHLSYSGRATAQWAALFVLIGLPGFFVHLSRKHKIVAEDPVLDTRPGSRTLLLFRLFTLLALILTLAWSQTNVWEGLPRTGLLFCALACILTGWMLFTESPSATGRSPKPISVVSWMVRNGAALYVAYSLTLVGNNLLSFVRDPRLAVWIPVFPLLNGFLWMVYALQRLLVFLVSNWGIWGVQVFGGILCLVDIVRPGAVLGLPDTVMDSVRPFLADKEKLGDGGKKSKVVLGVLLVILAVTAWRRFQEGLLTGATLSAAGGVVLRVVLPTLILFLLIRKSRLFPQEVA